MKWFWTGEETTIEDVKRDVGEGWGKIVENLIVDLYKLGWDGNIIQVKQKFGMLCFYISNGSLDIGNRVGEAVEQSRKTCEFCGNEGKSDTWRSWILTLCDGCIKKRRDGTLK